MQVTSTAVSRPAASPPAHTAEATGADMGADGESFASLLGAPAETAPRVKAAGPSRERQLSKADPARSPRSASTDGAPRPTKSNGAEQSASRTGTEATAAAEGDDGSTPLTDRGDARSMDEGALCDWLTTLIQWPTAADAPTDASSRTALPTPPTADADTLAGGSVSTGATSPDGRSGIAFATGSGPGPSDARPWSSQTRPGPDMAAGTMPDMQPVRADWLDDPSSNPASTIKADLASTTHRGHRGMDVGRDAARATGEALARTPAADLTSTPGGSEPQAEAAALAAGLYGGARTLTVSGTPADPGPVPLAAPSAIADKSPMAEAAPVTVPMPMPVDDPRFAQALGTQISLLARDGVHEAALQLNPAEMGPLSVQIVLDGTQARVEFGVDMARTRDVIERSLPELAAALREAGLTLSGGSVSQHQAGRGERQADPDGQRGRGGPERADRTSAVASDSQGTPTRRRVRQGGLDLYA